MFQFGKIISESFKFAFAELRNNPLRSILTLLGIYIGIFLIIFILTASDWLKNSINSSIKSLGESTVYVQKYPWQFSEDYPWWEYQKRPIIEYENYEALRENLLTAESVAYFNYYPDQSIKTHENQVSGISLYTCTAGADVAGTIVMKEGRFFNEAEARASQVAIVGAKLAKELFERDDDVIGEEFRLRGKKFRVIGVVSEDDNLIKVMDWDEGVIIPYTVSMTMFTRANFFDGAQWALVKAKDDVAFEEIRDDIVGVMRGSRQLRPTEDNNFAINRITTFLEALKGTNRVLDMTAFMLGVFALLIGGFGVANIMFVSVRERMKYIGLKKALGAKRWIIMSEFLIESVILCIIGSLAALLTLWGIVELASMILKVDFVLSLKNIILGVGIATAIGVVAGIVPAIIAANMDPVRAIRS